VGNTEHDTAKRRFWQLYHFIGYCYRKYCFHCGVHYCMLKVVENYREIFLKPCQRLTSVMSLPVKEAYLFFSTRPSYFQTCFFFSISISFIGYYIIYLKYGYTGKIQWTYYTHGSFYSVLVVNQPEQIITINTKQTKYLRSVPQESITGGKINGDIYIHCFASTGHGFDCSRTLLLCIIQVHPSTRLLVDRICSGLGGGGWVA
jgi:hypothetical protein